MGDNQQGTDFWAPSSKTETSKGEAETLNHIHNLFHINTYWTKFRSISASFSKEQLIQALNELGYTHPAAYPDRQQCHRLTERLLDSSLVWEVQNLLTDT